MSNSKNAIKEIKKLMVQFGFLSEDVSVQSFKLEDDTILNTEKLEVGSKIYKINEAFEQVNLEDGVYRLKENFEIEVSEGEIKSVKEVSEEPVEEVKEEVVVEEPVSEEPVKSEEVKEEFSAESQILEMFKDFIGKMNEKMSSLEEEVKSVKADFNKFKSEPAAPKIADGKTEQFNKNLDEIDSKVNQILNLRRNNNK